MTLVIINLVKLKITSDIKNSCISDDRCTDPMSGYMMTEDPESNAQLHERRIQNCIITINEYFQRYLNISC